MLKLRCDQRAKRGYDEAPAECDRLYLCGSSEVCCGSGESAQCNCVTCGNVCGSRMICNSNGECTCRPGTAPCWSPGYPLNCCYPGEEDCITCTKAQTQWSVCRPRSNAATVNPCASGPPKPCTRRLLLIRDSK